MSDPANLNHGHTDDGYVRLTVRVCARVKREAPDEASQAVRGLGGPAQAPPSHEQVVEWLAQGWPLYGAQPRGLGGPAQAPAVQEAPAAAVQAPVHVPVHNEQAPAAAVQAPAPRGPVRPRSTREKKQPESLKGYGRFGLF